MQDVVNKMQVSRGKVMLMQCSLKSRSVVGMNHTLEKLNIERRGGRGTRMELNSGGQIMIDQRSV